MELSDICRLCNEVSGVYQIECSETRKVYVGRSDSVGIRVMGHFYLLRKGTHYNKKLQSDYNLYGEKCFSFSVLEECSSAELKEVEGFFIRALGKRNLYNKHMSENTGAEAGTCSEETKKKQSERQKGEKNHFYGRKHSEESKRKIAASHLGRKKIRAPD